jgi:hypothetical protein
LTSRIAHDRAREDAPLALRSAPKKREQTGQRFGTSNHDVAHRQGDEEARGDNRMHSMLTLLLESSIFVAGFVAGYVACAWRWRRTHYATIAPRVSMFGHTRRAF